jgi:hypothetical protein
VLIKAFRNSFISVLVTVGLRIPAKSESMLTSESVPQLNMFMGLMSIDIIHNDIIWLADICHAFNC